MTQTSQTTDRRILKIEGADAVTFLQGLVSNDVLPLAKAPGLVWAALLTPQGKYLADFFIIRRPGDPEGLLFLDIHADLAPQVQRLLTLYKLRAAVTISAAELQLQRGTGPAPEGALPDPRHEALGWRLYTENLPDTLPQPPDQSPDWDAIRLAHLIPEYPNELQPNETFILEQGFERLHGVNFRKGCYVGQEVTARMKHKTELRKGLVRLEISGTAAPGTPITLSDGREAGRLGTSHNGKALAHMRFDRMGGPLIAGEAQLQAEAG
ncbi:folate-binding protein YgfZ [Xinfangfangia sp. D13-10-4-6]|uniref:CAF17-like 4Fe-4S cluster assembly/insertion protein YgfZ n=1 Tax=Pseudogemmobacter hezensis TaxID=2737662 RepID=UPI0015563C9E|nr:folate-binding protein YgfZ [Pseudogemmobacter hezensis]NPD15936.1 folate-binding protein YgfZ [Pseudogemmobacter hezensis]